MTKTVVLELPERLEKKLIARAQKLNLSLESLIIQSLAQWDETITQEEIDPIAPLIGTLTTSVNDIGDNHDLYLGNSLQQELKLEE